MAVRGLAARREPALDVAVEGNAELQQILDAEHRLARDGKRGFLVHRACARRNRIGGVGFGRVARFDGRGDAALRPGARCAVTDGRAREDSDGARAEFQRREEARKPRADDQNVAGIDDVALGHDGVSRDLVSCRD